MSESEEELKSLLMRVKEKSERVSLKLNTKKTKIMASGPITSWQIEGKGGSSDRFPLLGSKITVYGDCSREIRRRLLLGREAVTNLDSVLKSRDVTLLTEIHIVKAMVFPVSRTVMKMYHEEGRMPKNRCLQTVVLEKTPKSPLDRKEIKPVKGSQS